MVVKKRKSRKGIDPGTLPEHCKGQLRNPEIQAKALATRKRNAAERKARKEAATTGFARSVASDPEAQAAMINKLWGWAMSEDFEQAKFAMKMLNDMGVVKQPQEKAIEADADKKVDIEPEDAINILKAASKKNLEDLNDEDDKV